MSMSISYNSTLEYLYSLLPAYHRIGKAAYRNNLDNTLALDEYFGHPHTSYHTIHIAGTNGKGSVSHMIASVLMESGFSTGLYTSPHLKDFRERIKINGRMIPAREVTDFVKKHKNIIESLKPSFFELTAAMAFDYFSRAGVDIAVIETGMGGRLDSTNIITPVLSVITNIGHDHMDLLGDTFGKIAAEKAGIIKQGVPVIIGETQSETKEIFTEKAREMTSEICFADHKYFCTLNEDPERPGIRNYRIKIPSEEREISGRIPLGGDYQAKNLQTIFQAFEYLRGKFPIDDGTITGGVRKVIVNTRLMGRWQILRKRPLVICDAGHNREGIEYVVRQIKKMNRKQVHFVLGFVSDKDLSLVLPLFPWDARYYFARASVQRALDEKVLKEAALGYGLSGDCFGSVRDAFAKALENASPDDLIFIGGSIFVVAEVL